MPRRPILILVMLVALLSACSGGSSSAPLTIDPSTPETTQKSIEAIQNSLPEAERDKFSTALSVVIAHALGGGYQDVGDTPEGRERVRAALRGKTAQEVIAAAEQIAREQKASGEAS